MDVVLKRVEQTGGRTRGIMLVDGVIQVFTVEKPWRDNKTGISCIPEGVYQVVRHVSPSKGECFKLLGTEPRTDILIHVANWERELQGCIGVGMNFGNDEHGGVMESRRAMKHILAILPDKFEIAIVNV